jgi:hypothetical protein
MKKLSFLTAIVAALVIVIAAFTSCQEEFVNEQEAQQKSGNLVIKLTDAPFPTDLVAEANVTINKIDIRKTNEDDEYPFITLSEEEQSFNLLDLTNGVTAILSDTAIDSGSYNLIRLYVSDASIKLTDETVYDLKIPSGAQTGIKVFIDPEVTIEEDSAPEVILDFDVSRSFIVQGNPNTPAGIKGFIFKPTIKASTVSTTGTLEGKVTDTADAAIIGAQVSIIAADTVYTSSFTGDDGGYAILGIDPGTYEVQFAKEGYKDSIVDNVAIAAANATLLDVKLESN